MIYVTDMRVREIGSIYSNKIFKLSVPRNGYVIPWHVICTLFDSDVEASRKEMKCRHILKPSLKENIEARLLLRYEHRAEARDGRRGGWSR